MAIAVIKHFDQGDLIFVMEKPFIAQETGDWTESDKWMVYIHIGALSSLTASYLTDPGTKKVRLFSTQEEALSAAINFAHESGLKDAE